MTVWPPFGSRRARLVFGAVLALAGAAPIARSAAADPVVSLWYRGVPAGTPRIDDLLAIHATGVSSITWPQKQTTHLVELRSLALKAGLDVIVRVAEPVTVTTATPPVRSSRPEQLDLSLSSTPARAVELCAIIWNEIAHGARMISLDPQPATGLVRWSDDPELRAWGRAAGATAKDVSRFSTLITSLRPGPKAVLESVLPPNVDFAFLDAGRSWAIIATNRSSVRQSVQIRFPKDVAAAEWMNLLTSTVVAMIARTDGPRWTCALDPWEAKVMVIDKRPH